MGEVITSALVSGIISVGLFGVIKWYIDRKLQKVDEEKRRHEQVQHRRSKANAKLRRAQGRLFFWMHHGMIKPPPNGELEEAWTAYQEAEEESKELDQEIIAHYELDG